MYDQIEAHADSFDHIRATLASGDHVRIAAIRNALEATAQKLSDTQTFNDLDRDNIAKLYRGFLAAARVIGQLEEQQTGKTA